MNTGLHLDSINYSILSYCDDIILLSTSLRQAQNMVDTCSKYGKKWNLTFNEKKSNILHTGKKIYNNSQIKINLNNKMLNVVENLKYLGLNLTEKMNFDSHLTNKFSIVQKSYNSLYKYGSKPYGLDPFTKAFIYNTYCLPKGTYGIAITSLTESMISKLNIVQNSIIRSTLGLSSYNHLAGIRHILNIKDVKEIYFKMKCSLVKLINRHDLTKSLLNTLNNSLTPMHKYSFISDLTKISHFIEKPLSFILNCPTESIKAIKSKFDSVQTQNTTLSEISECL